jgi:hypothetical protein
MAPIKAGTWHLVGDGIVFDPGDVTFDILWRDSAGDHPIATVTHHFDPLAAGNYQAQPFETDLPGAAADAKAYDQLILRFSVTSTSTGLVYIPNGDGANAQGRIPSITLPK